MKSIFELLKENFSSIIYNKQMFIFRKIDSDDIYERFAAIVDGHLINVCYQSKFGEIRICIDNNEKSKEFLNGVLIPLVSEFIGEEPYVSFNEKISSEIRHTIVWSVNELYKKKLAYELALKEAKRNGYVDQTLDTKDDIVFYQSLHRK